MFEILAQPQSETLVSTSTGTKWFAMLSATIAWLLVSGMFWDLITGNFKFHQLDDARTFHLIRPNTRTLLTACLIAGVIALVYAHRITTSKHVFRLTALISIMSAITYLFGLIYLYLLADLGCYLNPPHFFALVLGLEMLRFIIADLFQGAWVFLPSPRNGRIRSNRIRSALCLLVVANSGLMLADVPMPKVLSSYSTTKCQ